MSKRSVGGDTPDVGDRLARGGAHCVRRALLFVGGSPEGGAVSRPGGRECRVRGGGSDRHCMHCILEALGNRRRCGRPRWRRHRGAVPTTLLVDVPRVVIRVVPRPAEVTAAVHPQRAAGVGRLILRGALAWYSRRHLGRMGNRGRGGHARRGLVLPTARVPAFYRHGTACPRIRDRLSATRDRLSATRDRLSDSSGQAVRYPGQAVWYVFHQIRSNPL
jgi:hypothetical protein